MLRGERYRRSLRADITEHFLRSILDDYQEEGLRNALKALSLHIQYYEEKTGARCVTPRRILEKWGAVLQRKTTRDTEKLPAYVLEKATPEYIWSAVQQLISGTVEHPFFPSTDYDLLTEEGHRFPPKAVFGIALATALDDESIGPSHFSAGLTSPCFRLLKAAGYEIVSKGELAPDRFEAGQEWSEGEERVRVHRGRERSRSLVVAKKSQYVRLHGRLTCEECGFDPIAVYGSQAAEACIEVHHAERQVSEMSVGHKTKLDDLRCLCANCHRFIHRKMKDERAFDS